MTKETIKKIIRNNRTDFAVHQLWAVINKQQEALKWAALHLDEKFLDAHGYTENNPVINALKNP